jgi:hypothetical protein
MNKFVWISQGLSGVSLSPGRDAPDNPWHIESGLWVEYMPGTLSAFVRLNYIDFFQKVWLICTTPLIHLCLRSAFECHLFVLIYYLYFHLLLVLEIGVALYIRKKITLEK